MECSTGSHGLVETHSNALFLVTKASGYFYVRNLEGGLNLFPLGLNRKIAEYYYIYTQRIVWKFSLDPKLSQNLTFPILDFSRRPKKLFCRQASIHIQRTSSDIYSHRQLFFCEHHPQFSVFPSFQDISVNLTTFPLIDIKIDILFVVFDRGLITTQRELFPFSTSQKPRKPFSNIISSLNIVLQRWLLKVDKLEQILINTRFYESFSIFDGPDLFSEENHNKSWVITTTFQCVIQLLVHNFHKQYQPNISFVAKQRQPHLVIFMNKVGNKTISLPNDNCSEMICVLVLKSAAPSFINVSISKFSHHGHTDHNCVFGGLQKVDFTNTSKAQKRGLLFATEVLAPRSTQADNCIPTHL